MNLIDKTDLMDKLQEELDKHIDDMEYDIEWSIGFRTAMRIVREMKTVKLDIIRTDIYD